MSLLAESKVGFLDARHVASEKVVTTAVLSESVPTTLKGTVKGPVAQSDFSEFLDAQGNKIAIPKNAVPKVALLSGNTTFPLTSFITCTDNNKTDWSVNFGNVTSAQVNSGCLLYLFDVNASANLYPEFNIVSVLMDNGPLLEGEHITITLGYS